MDYIMSLIVLVVPMALAAAFGEYCINYYYRHLSFTVMIPFP